jgi:hypothetical protein
VNAYFNKAVGLYNTGDYETALKGFKKLFEFIDTDLKIIIIPHIEKCKRVLENKFSDSDKRHMENQAILKYFSWVDKIKYLTGFASSIFLALLTGSPEEGTTFLNNFSGHPSFLLWATLLAVITFLLHRFMKKFTVSKGLIRCKYCGRNTYYIDPDESTYGYMNNNNCNKCGRMYPVPDFYWDGWEGLDEMEKRHSVPDEKFYSEYNELKEKYSKEFSKFKTTKDEEEKIFIKQIKQNMEK